MARDPAAKNHTSLTLPAQKNRHQSLQTVHNLSLAQLSVNGMIGIVNRALAVLTYFDGNKPPS